MLKQLEPQFRGYIKGVFFGDGYKYYFRRDRKYTVEFHLDSERNKQFIASVFSLLRECGYIINKRKDKRSNCIRLRVARKSLFYTLTKNVSELNLPESECLGFVSGLLDADGHVNHKKSTIVIANTNQKALSLVLSILHKYTFKEVCLQEG